MTRKDARILYKIVAREGARSSTCAGADQPLARIHASPDHNPKDSLMLDLTGKVALVMGCGSVAEGWGNGRATAALLARQGAKVYGTDLKLENAQVTQKAVEAEGNAIHVE